MLVHELAHHAIFLTPSVCLTLKPSRYIRPSTRLSIVDFIFYQKKISKISELFNTVSILNYEKCNEMSTYKSMLGPVVLQITCVKLLVLHFGTKRIKELTLNW